MVSAFECTRCGECCRHDGETSFVALLGEDIERLAHFLELSVQQVILGFCDEQSVYVEGESIFFWKLKTSGERCIFLGDDDLCEVHSVKPFQCGNAPERLFLSDFREKYECVSNLEPIDDSALADFFFRKLTGDNHAQFTRAANPKRLG